MIRVGERCTYGGSYYANDRPYPGDATVRLAAVGSVHADHPGAGFRLVSFRAVPYLDRDGIEAVHSQARFERVR